MYKLLFIIIILTISPVSSLQAQDELTALNQPEQTTTRAKKTLESLRADSPNKLVNSVVFFQKRQSIESALKQAEVSQLNVTGFRHGTVYASGGYKMSEEETLPEAVKQYRHDYALFLKRDAELTQKIIANSSVDDSVKRQSFASPKEAAVNRLKQIHINKTEFEKTGIRIIGIEVRNSAAALDKAWKKNAQDIKLIRVQELKEPIANRFDE